LTGENKSPMASSSFVVEIENIQKAVPDSERNGQVELQFIATPKKQSMP